jgi:hypothetical protein
MPHLRSALFTLPLLWSMSAAPVAFAQDDLDELPDDFLGTEDSDGVKVKEDEAAAAPDEERSFDFGDDPDWDAAPAPVAAPAGLDEDPIEDIPAGGPADDFLSEDPPDDLGGPTRSPPPPATGGGGGAKGPALGTGLATTGKAPLGDHYPATIVAKDIDAVIVELPVLVAATPTDFKADFWLITEVLVEDRKVAESRHYVTRASVAELGPTVVWSKSHVPVAERAGAVEIRVSKMADESTPKPLFTKTVDYAL